MRARVVSLHRYPVKSAQVIDLDSARLGRHGLQYDRSWLIVDERDRFITQRTHPALARLEAHPEADGGLRLFHPAAGSIVLAPPPALTPPGDRAGCASGAARCRRGTAEPRPPRSRAA
ncbi:MAG: MOSC N-terminal beta barrel domain-containing protein [Gammaproteobacteria bacterium]